VPIGEALPNAVTEVLHGVQVVDPYRWLENRESQRTEAWIADQRRTFDNYFADLRGLDALRHRVGQFLNIEDLDQPARVGSEYFYRRRDKDREQACIFVKDVATNRERLLVDPSAKGPFVSVAIHRISEDGRLLAYEVKQGGGERKAIHVVDVGRESVLPDSLDMGHARGFVFASDKSGFYYCHELAADIHDYKIRFHRFDEPMDRDRVVFRLDRTARSKLMLTADEHNLGALFVHHQSGDVVLDFYLARREQNLQWGLVFANKALRHGPLLKDGRILVVTDHAARTSRIIELTRDGAESRVIVPEWDADIRQIAIATGEIYLSYMVDRETMIRRWTLAGEYVGAIELPRHGSIRLLPSFSSTTDSFFYTYESFTKPLGIFEYLPTTSRSVPVGKRVFPEALHPYVIEEAWYSSKDGTQIPLSLVMREDVAPAHERPTIMTGYGGFGVSMTPQFSILVAMMLEAGAVFALPNIRGGSEFGRAWHEAARRRNRQTAIDDFISAAEWLCARRVTRPDRLAIFGGSNSGLLVGAAMTQKPDQFQAMLCVAPLLDMVRYEQFDQTYKWQLEYGCVDDAEDFQALYAYSPYHHVREDVNYPSTLFVSGDKDDRCSPVHVRKMAARLQGRSGQKNKILVDYSPERGHSPTLPLSVRIESLTRRIAFLGRELGIELSARDAL
jgi:prolyl oligopeptidase